MKNNTQQLPAMDKLADTPILLLGYGKEGRAAERWLKARFGETIQLTIFDQNQGSQYLEEFLKKRAQILEETTQEPLVIKSAGVYPTILPQELEHSSATALFFSAITNEQRKKLIGVTGSKGKSTTASLIAAGLRSGGQTVGLVGNIGTPLLELIVPDDSGRLPIDRYDWVVCELSSYQLENLTHSPAIAVLTAFFPDHLDYHGSVEAYREAKTRITLNQHQDEVVVYHANDSEVSELIRSSPARRLAAPADLSFVTKDFPLIGDHNTRNMRLAYAVCHEIGISDTELESAFRSFVPLPHRLEQIAEVNGVLYIDDAISTTPDSTVAGLQALLAHHQDHKLGGVLLGGTNRGYDFSELARYLATNSPTAIVLFPDSGAQIRTALESAYATANLELPELLETRSMDQAVQWLAAQTQPGDLVVLSTASPSYSIWNNFEEKGSAFQSAVQRISIASPSE